MVSEPSVSSEAMAETRSPKKLTDAVAHETAKSLGSMAEARSTSHNRLIPMKYSWEEINTRREAGLCIFCDERETPDHHLKHKRLRLVMVDLAYTSLVDLEDLKRDSDLKAKVNEVVEIEIKTEVATKSIEKLVHEAFSDDESTPQFQVPIANSEILESIEPTEVNLGLENLESLVMNEDLEQDWVKQNINKRFEVEDDVDREQKVVRITKICYAHQVLGKMSQHEEKLGIKKKAKGFKSWMFKFKATKGNIRKQDNKGWFHTWRRKMSWRKNKTTKLQFVSQGKLFSIVSFQSSREFEVSRMVKENMMQIPKLLCQTIDQSRRDVTHVLPLYARSVLKLELQEAVHFSRGQITGFVLEMVDGCEQSTGMKVTHCAHQIFDVRPPMVQQKMKKEKSLKSWKFKFKPEKEDIKQQHNQVFYVSDFRIAMSNSQEILRGKNLEWKMKKLKCPKSWNFKFRYRALRTSKGSLLLLYFSVWHCWKMKFKLCLSRLIDLLQMEVLNHSTDHLVIVDKTDLMCHTTKNRRKFPSLKMKMHAYMHLLGSNTCVSTLGKRKLGKDWWFKYKTLLMAKDLLANHQKEQLRIRHQRMMKLSQALRFKPARLFFTQIIMPTSSLFGDFKTGLGDSVKESYDFNWKRLHGSYSMNWQRSFHEPCGQGSLRRGALL